MSEENNKSSSDQIKKGFSRRSFIRGAGLTTAGTFMMQSSVLALEGVAEATAKGKEFGPDAVSMNFHINGKKMKAVVEPRETLAEVLRYHLNLTGTKVVCDRGSCSACTVWVDGKPVNSCLTLAMDVGDKEVTTIEGIANGDELHPVQEAFIDHDATQCGYCTPGMIMTSVHLLNENPTPELKDVKHAIRGNLCRCGTHPHVFKAVMDASKKMK